ncbi:MAG TPA: hypothetical protein VJP85_06655 [Candidatus Baltobacteraceae bacterium]|nr:hypothetical protein [Candidatus Baltobacteraceae bacterium]
MNDRNNHEKDDDPKSERERLQDEKGTEREAPMAPHQNRPPSEQHRGGPLPNQKK